MLPRKLGHQASVGITQSEELGCYHFPLHTVGELQEDNPACTAIKQQHQCDYAVNLSRASEGKAKLQLPLGADWGLQTLRQACYRENPKAQCAFKILMIHEVLQFALRIAFRCVLHRCGSLDIRC